MKNAPGSMAHPDTFVICVTEMKLSLYINVTRGLRYKHNSMIKSMIVIMDFLMWFLIGWQLCWQPIRRQVWKSLIVIMDFIMELR